MSLRSVNYPQILKLDLWVIDPTTGHFFQARRTWIAPGWWNHYKWSLYLLIAPRLAWKAIKNLQASAWKRLNSPWLQPGDYSNRSLGGFSQTLLLYKYWAKAQIWWHSSNPRLKPGAIQLFFRLKPGGFWLSSTLIKFKRKFSTMSQKLKKAGSYKRLFISKNFISMGLSIPSDQNMHICG